MYYNPADRLTEPQKDQAIGQGHRTILEIQESQGFQVPSSGHYVSGNIKDHHPFCECCSETGQEPDTATWSRG